jgi:hypothetical protein
MVLPAVLKRRHSLKGHNVYQLIKRFAEAEMPKEHARFHRDTPLDEMATEELSAEFKRITTEDMDGILGCMGKSSTDSNRLLLAHSAILMANEIGQPSGQDLQVREIISYFLVIFSFRFWKFRAV